MKRWAVLAVMALAGCGGRQAEAKQEAAALLRDPSSAQFRDVRELGNCVVGEINGKNGFGAYAGFKEFIVDSRGAVIEPEQGRLMDPDPAEIAKVAAETDFMRRHTACLQSSL